MAAKFRLEIVTPQKHVYSGEVESLRVSAYDGSLGILAHHAPMLAELVPGVMYITTEGGIPEIYSITGGFLEVGGNRAIILADAAEKPDEIDLERAKAAKKRAEKRLKERKEFDVDRAEFALKRALARLHVAEKMKQH